jgi:soluble lytic murein transglycosylase-like protein
MKLLDEEINRFGDLRLALAAYNAGSPAVKAAMKKARSERFEDVYPHLFGETQAYVSKVLKKLKSFEEI